MNKRKLIFTSVAIIGLIVFKLFFFQDYVANVGMRNLCRQAKKAYYLELNGVVIKKYLDEYNHQSETIKITSKKGMKTITFLTSEQGELFDNIMSGDSIVKKSESMNVILFRGSKKSTYKLDYICSEADFL